MTFKIHQRHIYEVFQIFFRSGTDKVVMRRSLLFFCFFCLLFLGQAFFWLFANRIEPLLIGMPFGMFFIMVLAVLQFFLLLLLYIFEASDDGK